MGGHSIATQWKVVRHIPVVATAASTAAATKDTLITDYKEANYNGNIAFPTDGYPGILLRAFGKDGANKTANVVISGWMTDTGYGKHGTGPGQRLFEGELQTGALTNASIPELGAAATWYEVDVWTSDSDLFTDIPAGANVGCRRIGGLADFQQSMLLVPLAGYTRIMAEITVPGSTDMTELGILGRLVTRDQMDSLEMLAPPFVETMLGSPTTAPASIANGADETYIFATPRKQAYVEILAGAAGTPLYGRWNQSSASATSFEFVLDSAAVSEARRVHSPPGVRVTSVTLFNGSGAAGATYDTHFVVRGMV